MANQSLQSFGAENVGEFTTANISYFSESAIWLGKILANDVCFGKFAKFTKVFPTRILRYTVTKGKGLDKNMALEPCIFTTINRIEVHQQLLKEGTNGRLARH